MRDNSFAFYTIAIASFLESTAKTFVDNLKPIFEDNELLCVWLEEEWLPDELEHGRLTRQYVNHHWPEFDWDKAYREFYSKYGPKCQTEQLRKTPGLEALSRCVVEAETSMIYRCLGDNGDDANLKGILYKISTDEVRHYKMFRRAFTHYDEKEKLGFFQKANIIFGRSRTVRDEDLATAFSAMDEGWGAAKPFKDMSYSDFHEEMGRMMKKHFPIQEASRMLFKPLRTGGKINGISISAIEFMVKRLYRKMA